MGKSDFDKISLNQMSRFIQLVIFLGISRAEFSGWLDEIATTKRLPIAPVSLPKKSFGLYLHEIFPKSKIEIYTVEKGMVQRVYNFFMSVSYAGIADNIENLAVMIKQDNFKYKNLGKKTKRVVLEILKGAGYLG